MIADLKPYPAMKESGVPWLGEVPEHWATRPLKHWVRMNAQVLPETTDPHRLFRYLDIASVGTGILTRKPQTISFGGAPSRARRVVRNSDTIVSTVRTYLKAVYFAGGDTDDLICSTGFAVLTPRSGTVPEFVSYLTQSSSFTDRVTADSVGIAYPAVGETRLGSFHVAVPPLPEQAAIVRFLDHVDRRIRRYIGAKQRLIKLLQEQKQATIHRAVTRGLDPSVRLKPSGVEWLGEVPEHWEVWQIGHFSQVGSGSTPSRANSAYWTAGHYPWLNSANANQESVTQADQFVTETALRDCHLPIVAPGSVLVAITGQGKTRGKAAVLRVEATINQHLAFITPHATAASAGYLHLALSGAYAQLRSISDDSGSTKGALTCGDLKHFKLALPPVTEQEAILTSVDTGTRSLDSAIGRARRGILFLGEYRTRVIADVVTGKLDVREAVARLPEETGEREPLGKAGALNDVEEEAAEDEPADELEAVPEEVEA